MYNLLMKISHHFECQSPAWTLPCVFICQWPVYWHSVVKLYKCWVIILPTALLPPKSLAASGMKSSEKRNWKKWVPWKWTSCNNNKQCGNSGSGLNLLFRVEEELISCDLRSKFSTNTMQFGAVQGWLNLEWCQMLRVKTRGGMKGESSWLFTSCCWRIICL